MHRVGYTALELFGGAGGMAEGFRRAGLPVTHTFDWSQDAVESYEANLGHRPVRMDVHDLVRMAGAGWHPATVLDLIVADPPCTPWSRAGKRRGLEDDRDMLLETVALICELRPRAYLIGNVPGLQDAPNEKSVQAMLAPLAEAGYCVTDFASLDAADYGVPQHRIRPFWFGHLEGPCITWPEQTYCSPECASHPHLPGIESLLPWVTCRDALGQLPVEELGEPVRLRWRQKADHRPSHPDAPAAAQMARPNESSYLVNDKHPICELEQPARTVTARDRGGQASSVLRIDETHASFADEPSKVVMANTSNPGAYLADSRQLGRWHGGHMPSHADQPALVQTANGTGAASSVMVAADDWPWSRPATTVTGDDRIPPPGHHRAQGSYMSQGIKLSERARALLQGFPDESVVCTKCGERRWVESGNGHGMARDIPAVPSGALDRDSDDCNTSSSGNATTAPSPKATKSTTATATNQTTASRTSKRSRRSNTNADTAAASSVMGSGGYDVSAAARSRRSAIGTSQAVTRGGTNPATRHLSPNANAICGKCGAATKPDRGWRFAGRTKSSRSAQIGMAMPPPLAHAVATAIAAQLEDSR